MVFLFVLERGLSLSIARELSSEMETAGQGHATDTAKTTSVKETV